MKESSICPKCKSAGVIRIKAFKGSSTANRVQLSKWGTQFTFFDNYICTSCGFMEHYVNLEDKGWEKWIEKQRANDTLDSEFV
jgi:hypothetical protein